MSLVEACFRVLMLCPLNVGLSLCKCDLSQYHWNEAVHFPGKILFLLKTITESDRRGVVYLNLVLSTANGGNVL